MIFKVIKPKLIDIVDYNYDYLTGIIVVSSNLYFKNKKKIGMLFSKIFLNNNSLFLVKNKYNEENIRRILDCELLYIKNIYNRNCINIFLIVVDYSINKIKLDKTEYLCKYNCFFVEDLESPKLVKSSGLNSHVTTKIVTPYFSIKIKNLIRYLY